MLKSVNNSNRQCNICTFSTICAHTEAESACAGKSAPAVSKQHPLKRGEVLYTYRDDFKSVFAVNSGAIKTFQVDMDGQERIHNFYLPGEIIGLEAIHLGYYPYSAIAIAASTVCEVPFENLLDLVSSSTALQRPLIDSLSQRIHLGQYVTAPAAEQRVASFLLDIAKRLRQTNENKEIELPMSRYDIGNYLGLAPETISRILTRFQQSNLISVNNKKIKLTDAHKLQWIAQEGVT